MIRNRSQSRSFIAAIAGAGLALALAGCGAPGGGSEIQSALARGSLQGTVHNVYITWYGFNDNSCQVESDHNCNTIAFPSSDGWPVAHDIATEGSGTFDDPVTFATAANNDGSGAEIAIGTKIYVPLVRKYFVMEDQCFECGQEWKKSRSPHVDLWMGPSFGSAEDPLINCEDDLTQGSPFHGTGTIIVNPASNLTVESTPLFTNDTCTAKTF